MRSGNYRFQTSTVRSTPPSQPGVGCRQGTKRRRRAKRVNPWALPWAPGGRTISKPRGGKTPARAFPRCSRARLPSAPGIQLASIHAAAVPQVPTPCSRHDPTRSHSPSPTSADDGTVSHGGSAQSNGTLSSQFAPSVPTLFRQSSPLTQSKRATLDTAPASMQGG
jgi:hypothetical protein